MLYTEEDIVEFFKQQPLPDKVFGIGDDCAVIPKDYQSSWLISTDALVEDVHFTLNTISPQNLGAKSVKVNVSDIVAMGGTPRFILFSCAIPPYLDNSFIKGYIEGIKNEIAKYGIYSIGGDTVSSKSKFFISVTIIGEAKNDKIKYRYTAKIGDIICLTGKPGLSAMGLELLNRNIKQEDESSKRLIEKHHLPYIYLKEGKFLAQHQCVHAMMDCSDGLNKDLSRLCIASNCSANVLIDQIPVDHDLEIVSKEHHWDINQFLLTGGEDYILIFTVQAEELQSLSDAYLSTLYKKFYQIGRIVPKKEQNIFYSINGVPFLNTYQNFKHF